ncbi:fungal pheromone mating factor STE2 GPCR-domain-containing protein [Thermothelomyces heterothallicus CBS 202.75]|uniref:fungal pheromone mating factor STE2 GPCR-domain-containing protein n=1 Tax=Thermothelomyces heterothallicus CBS 202.75 TaxID=1149848 RepID=UPI003743ED27
MSTNDTTITTPTPETGPPSASFNPLNQTSFVLYSDGTTPIPFNTHNITEIYLQATSLSILYGTQVGACVMMLAVVMGMTPSARFRRAPTLVSAAALALNAARMVLLALFFTSAWVDLYVIVSQDAAVVPRRAFELSAAATALSVPVTALILAALCLQAWSMLRLWSVVWKVPAAAASLGLVGLTMGFSITTTVIQVRAILFADLASLADWARQTYLILITASICWFCFLFNVRLVVHMWTNRSILPSTKGLKAMDVLVITNGILMFVPVVFSALEFGNWERFEPASITQTSVIVILPLGTLVAQRLANPSWFGTGQSVPDSPRSTGMISSIVSRDGISGDTAVSTANRPLLMSSRGHRTDSEGVHRGGGKAAISTRIAAASRRSMSFDKGQAANAVEVDMLAGGDVALVDLERGVRVGYGIERRVERLPTGGS